jgi:uncharacterized protein
MPSGLAALLDDVAGIAKLAAASVDDVGAAAARAGAKSAGVVIDDTAVTPAYVTGFSPERELPIIWRIALGSLRNKIVVLLPAALLLSAFAPWAITPLLMLGGAYLCFEGAEKVLEKLGGHHEGEHIVTAGPQDHALLEKEKVAGAVRTDFILSAEIMAIALADLTSAPDGVTRLPVTGDNWIGTAASLALVALAVTVGVYGVVALIVKMDDAGLALSRRPGAAGLGRALVKGMPRVLAVLSVVGTAAMIWVGGGIVLHGLHEYHLDPTHDWVERLSHGIAGENGFGNWLVHAVWSGIFGLVLGALIAFVATRFHKAH